MKGGLVLPLSLANAGETVLVARVGGRPDVKKRKSIWRISGSFPVRRFRSFLLMRAI